MKRRFIFNIMICLLIFFILTCNSGLASPTINFSIAPEAPIVIIVADKMNSLELFRSKLPAVRKFLAESSCGLMSIRSGKGYSDSGSGYLSLGAGGRSTSDPAVFGAYYPEESISGNSAESYLSWSIRQSKIKPDNLVVPDMGMLVEMAKESDFRNNPGLLGDVFRKNGWKTCLLGNLDLGLQVFRPGGLLTTDINGVIDEGDISKNSNIIDRFFPYQSRFNVKYILDELHIRLSSKKLIVIEYGDFYRLDASQQMIPPDRIPKLDEENWNNFSRLLDGISRLQSEKSFSTVLVSPSVSQSSKAQGNLLGPIVIQNSQYSPGLLTSGTTKWIGVIANNDFLPTISHIAGLKPALRVTGRIMTARPINGHVQKILSLNNRLSKFYQVQRPLLNWYMGIISAGWIGGLICIWFRKKIIGSFIISLVMAVPLVLIILPLFPSLLWGVPAFGLLTLISGYLLAKVSDIKKRILILAALTWGILIIDQILGWRLIRYSALGYSAIDGSRYYGIGNEYMGIFLAAALIVSQLIYEKSHRKWPVWIVLGCTISVLCLPQLGAKFGGILSGAVGFIFYLVCLYKIKLNNKKLWIAIGAFGLVLFSIGLWDSLRPPEFQTHIGRFIRLFWTKDFGGVLQIILRKLNMNLKLTVVSPWMRITWLAIGVGLGYRLVYRTHLIKTENTRMVWKGILLTGITAYLVNDAGVLALATCLAFGFSYILLMCMESERNNP